MDNITDWIYHHKTLLITCLILLIGSIGSVFALKKTEETQETPPLIGDSLIEESIEENRKEELEIESEITILPWRIDIKGEVQNPGVYQVAENTRIYEVIEQAGGLTENAYTENINLSKKLSDEMVIYIYSKEEYQKRTTCNVKNTFDGEISEEIEAKKSIIEQENSKEESKQKISINQATNHELMKVEGIGDAKATSIINYRIENNSFKSLEELKEVSGIGESLYEKIKDYLTI